MTSYLNSAHLFYLNVTTLHSGLCCRKSVCLSSVTFVHPTQRFEACPIKARSFPVCDTDFRHFCRANVCTKWIVYSDFLPGLLTVTAVLLFLYKDNFTSSFTERRSVKFEFWYSARGFCPPRTDGLISILSRLFYTNIIWYDDVIILLVWHRPTKAIV